MSSICYDLGMYCKTWLHQNIRRFFCVCVLWQKLCFKNLHLQEIKFQQRNASLQQLLFYSEGSYISFKLKKIKAQQTLPAHTDVFVPLLYRQLDQFLHTHPLTQTLLSLHSCTQTLRSHVKLLTRNQFSKLWQSLTQTQTCFMPSPSLENHMSHLSLLNLLTQVSQIQPISTPDNPISFSSNALLFVISYRT